MRRILFLSIIGALLLSGFLIAKPGLAYSYPNESPQLTCPFDDSVHCTETFHSTGFSVSDPDGDPVSVSVLDITPPAFYLPGIVGYHVEWPTTCQEDGDYLIRLVAIDTCGAEDTCGFMVTVYNRPPQIICPEDDSVYAGETFESTDFSTYDPDGDFVSVYILDINPQPTYYPTIADSHVVWETTYDDIGVYVIRLVASEMCQPKDTCEFMVSVVEEPTGQLTCPDDDSVHAGDYFVSTDFSITGPGADPANVTICGVDPSPVNMPTIVESHVEWQTECVEAGQVFTICLQAPVGGEIHDTCYFQVTVYNRPPVIYCPPDDSVHAGDYYITANFSVDDPDDDPVSVALCGVDPSPTNLPSIEGDHVEWQTYCADDGIFTICLEATDSCGAKDTCYFELTVYNRPPELQCPDNGDVHAGDTFISTDFSATDPDGDPVDVSLLDITPPATNQPQIVDNHVEWITTCDEDGDYVIRLVATDPCGIKDTCSFTVNVFNHPPVLVCPEDGIVHTGNTFPSTDFSVSDPDGDPILVSILDINPSATNDPTIVANHVEWITTCDEDGDYVIRLVATDDCGAKDTCGFTVNVYNAPPSLICPPDTSVQAGQLFQSDDFSASDPDGDPVTVTIHSITPTPENQPVIVASHVEWLTTTEEEGTYTITLRASDHCVSSFCTFYVTVTPPPDGRNKVWIGEIDCVDPGEYVSLPVYINSNLPAIGGFELEFEFDYTALCFVDAEPGDLLLDSLTDQNGIFWSWEYFTHRILPCPVPPCQKYKILVYGQAEMPNGYFNRGLCIPENANGVLVYLNFVVMNNENLRGLMIPVCFKWEGVVVDDVLVEDWECTENIFSSCDGNTIYTSSLLCEFNPDVCDDPGGDIQQVMVFQDSICGVNCGGILICPLGPDECKRGDVNMNTVNYEVADGVLFANYFVYGTGVFIHDLGYQICATDVNADGRTLTLSDLVYLIRVILHDAAEIPKLAPSSEVVELFVTDNAITAECTVPIAAMLFEFDQTVEPTLLADMEMVHNGNKILVWSKNGKTLSTAEVLNFSDAELVSVSAVDYDTRALETTITAKKTPASFALHAAYPNPFNPATNLSFTLPEVMNYTLHIYNVAGRLVRSYECMGSVGMNTVVWDGRDNSGAEVASGIYFYKLTTGSFSATEKMVMMK